MQFKDDDIEKCYQCNQTIYPGENYYKFKKCNYCSDKCLAKALIEEYFREIEECYLMTAQDKEEEFGDIQYHRMKNEGAI